MSRETLAWLRERSDGVPESLRRQIETAVEGRPESSIQAVLRGAADTLISRAVDQGRRADAAELLTADALITYLCEACSELDPGSLNGLS